MQQRFVEELLADPQRRQKQAAIRAGYSIVTAASCACNLLKKPEIKQAISEREQVVRQRLDAAAEKAYVDEALVVAGILNEIRSAKLAGQGAWQAATILRAYELLGKYLGMFKDQVEVGMDAQIVAALAAGRDRARGITEPEEEAEEKPNGADEPKPN
jgi:hypothetical protein